LEITGVRDAIVRENTAINERDGLPPKCIAPFVFGGTDEEIAHVIYRNKAGGVQSYGEDVIEITDERRQTHYIGITRPEVIQIYVN
ncbi:phage baseplate protein, partial [Salmonella enterica subsp. enterica serovar Typhimurium]|uniref:hypothetical protein n=1 Tax=Salmonella enterica TaxID=28901 RepID=UPI000CAD301E